MHCFLLPILNIKKCETSQSKECWQMSFLKIHLSLLTASWITFTFTAGWIRVKKKSVKQSEALEESHAIYISFSFLLCHSHSQHPSQALSAWTNLKRILIFFCAVYISSCSCALCIWSVQTALRLAHRAVCFAAPIMSSDHLNHLLVGLGWG